MTDSKREAIQDIILAYDALFIARVKEGIVITSLDQSQEFLNVVIQAIEGIEA